MGTNRNKLDISQIKKANPSVFILIGALTFRKRGPGTGKGTQCDLLVRKYGITHLSTGDLLRNEVKSGSERGKELDKLMKEGELVPMEVVLDLLLEAMVKHLSTGCKGFLIDGYPRDSKQAEYFEKEVVPCKIAIYLDACEETLIKRIMKRAQSSGRVDDNPETIKKRLKTFQKENTPILKFYEQKKKLVRIDAEHNAETVFAAVCQHTEQFMINQ